MHLAALLKERCPRCLEGRVFAGLVRMARECPSCGLAFEREAGYFLGAMYFSYGMGILVATPLAVLLWKQGIGTWWITLWCLLELIVLAPWLFRYSRVIWLHFDQVFDPR